MRSLIDNPAASSAAELMRKPDANRRDATSTALVVPPMARRENKDDVLELTIITHLLSGEKQGGNACYRLGIAERRLL